MPSREVIEAILKEGGFLYTPEAIRHSRLRVLMLYRARAYLAARLDAMGWTNADIGDVIGLYGKESIRGAIGRGKYLIAHEVPNRQLQPWRTPKLAAIQAAMLHDPKKDKEPT